MKYLRNVLLYIKSEEKINNLLGEIPGWEYKEKLRYDNSKEFYLYNENTNIVVGFVKLNDRVYKSMNVLPYLRENSPYMNDINEPQEKDIHNDILFKLCMEIKKKFVNHEIICGLIPCVADEI